MSSPTTTPPRNSDSIPWAQQFVERVQRACEFPGQRAALRSGLRRDVDSSPRMHSIVATLVPRADRGSEARERAWYAVAAMIASLPRAARKPRHDAAEENQAESETTGEAVGGSPAAKRTRPRDLGVCMAEAVTRKAIRDNTAEARLNLLCRQSVEGLHRHLPSTIRQLATTSDAIDWTQLLRDVRGWEDRREEIARRWLQSYYRARFTAERNLARSEDDAEQNPERPEQA